MPYYCSIYLFILTSVLLAAIGDKDEPVRFIGKVVMKRRIHFVVCLIVVCINAGCQGNSKLQLNSLTPVTLRCEYRTDPMGIDIQIPRLSWILESDLRDQFQ